uniref:Small ribosomal subunit protein uS3c n=1 Tax=Lecanorchis japonica TaxID=915449 RepID=A0A6G7KVY3_9ASPA|nr:ribosomal protein S3 [Lecanorchis japonica]QII89420.1 ribosomal protein S3 [Lecanorchis japonica]
MGQKINPLGFRLGTIQTHHSLWFAQQKKFSIGIQEDEKIRSYIKNYVKKNKRRSWSLEGIAHIRIKKKIDLIQVIIYIGFPNLLIEGRTCGVGDLQSNVQKEFHSVNRRIYIAIKKIEKPYRQPHILAEYIALQLRNRVSFRKTIKKTIQLTEQTDTKGIQIKIAGRIDGKEIAHVKRIKMGRIPLQTICAQIDYCSHTIRTIYGVLGIKIWIFLNHEKD